MGHSITEETHNKIETNRRAGRLCAGGYRHCTAKAIWKIDLDGNKGWIMCTRHAKDFHVGYRGQNFTVTGKCKF